jgi:hypothetical protein
MGILKELGIVKGDDLMASTIFENLIENFFEIKYNKPSEYVNYIWGKYEEIKSEKVPKNAERNVNGRIFEFIISTLLVRENIFPVFLNAKVAFVPNINYDIMLYSRQRGPICISVKTSFRERYKQADLEAIALKYVHRKSLTYLVTLSESGARDVNEKIRKGDVIGVDEVIAAKTDNINALITSLKLYTFTDSPTKKVIESNQIITFEKISVFKQ